MTPRPHEMAALSAITGPVTPLPGGVPLVTPGSRVAQGPQGIPQRRVQTRPTGPMPDPDAINAARFTDPRAAVPAMPAPSAPMMPPGAPGGLGGLGGATFGDSLQALGQSIMSSPNGWWTRDFAGNMQAAQDRRAAQQQQGAARHAIEQALVRMGLSPEEAATFAADPKAVEIVAKQMQAERERANAEAARAAQQQLLGGMTPLDTFTRGGGAPAQRDYVPLGEGLPPLDDENPAPLGFRYQQPSPGNGEAQAAGMPADRTNPEARLAQLESMRQERLQLLGSGMLDTAGRARIETELRAIQDWTNHYQASIRDNASERQIRALEARGMSRGEAENIVYGFVRPETDPVRGGTRLVDVVEGTITPLREITTEGPRAAEPSPVPKGQTLYGNVEDATGLFNSVRSGLADTVGQVPLVGRFFDAAETVEARQRFAVSTNELIRALSINPRFPVAEMERLREEINIAPSAMRSTEATRNRMRVIDEALRRRLENERRAADDANLPAETRRAAAQAANDIANFLAALGVPRGPQPGTVERGDDGSEWRFRGGDPADPTSWERVR